MANELKGVLETTSELVAELTLGGGGGYLPQDITFIVCDQADFDALTEDPPVSTVYLIRG
jgi:hypothetical protein